MVNQILSALLLIIMWFGTLASVFITIALIFQGDRVMIGLLVVGLVLFVCSLFPNKEEK